jgi:hypothetical protein
MMDQEKKQRLSQREKDEKVNELLFVRRGWVGWETINSLQKVRRDGQKKEEGRTSHG